MGMKTLIHHIRVPAEQFAYLETDFEGSAEEAVELYRHITALVKGGEGLPEKEFDLFIENQVSGKTNHLETYQKMSPEQQKFVQINKRAIKRAVSKEVEKEELYLGEPKEIE